MDKNKTELINVEDVIYNKASAKKILNVAICMMCKLDSTEDVYEKLKIDSDTSDEIIKKLSGIKRKVVLNKLIEYYSENEILNYIALSVGYHNGAYNNFKIWIDSDLNNND